MRRFVMLCLTAVVLVTLFGCSNRGDYSARFLRYDTLQDGSRVAVVSPVAPGSDEEQIAYTNDDDLKPGELMVVKWVGRSWETPQWKPEREAARRSR